MCGVMGVIGTKQASQQVLMGLALLQHRGQDAAGILSHDTNGFHMIKNLGLADQVFNVSALETLTGTVALGHVRYGTTGKSEVGSVQPFLINYPYGIGMVHNGNLVNYTTLAKELREESHRHPLTTSDTEVILNLFAEALSKNIKTSPLSFHAITAAVQSIQEKARGSYSIVTLIAGYGLVAFKDPNGIRPLIYGQRTEEDGKVSHLFSSESGVASFLGCQTWQDLKPGEVMAVTNDGQVFRAQLKAPTARPCMFEWVYFASPQSTIEQVPVYSARIELGKKLANKIKVSIKNGSIKPDIIVPVPETARIAAIALAESLQIPYREVLIKNRYISRTFILDTQAKREKAVELKMAPVLSELRGKNVLLVDDSIVRGTTSKKLIDLVRQSGAKEVYFVSTAPKIKHPCFYGIDFPVKEELAGFERSDEEVCKLIGADALIYQDIEDLELAMQPSTGEKLDFCLACLNGKYPTEVDEAQVLVRKRKEDRNIENEVR